jgi:hypothetical protein
MSAWFEEINYTWNRIIKCGRESSLISFLTIELPIGRKLFMEGADVLQGLLPPLIAFDIEGSFSRNADLNLVAFP